MKSQDSAAEISTAAPNLDTPSSGLPKPYPPSANSVLRLPVEILSYCFPCTLVNNRAQTSTFSEEILSVCSLQPYHIHIQQWLYKKRFKL